VSIFKIGPFSHAPVKDVNIFPKFEMVTPPQKKHLLDPAKKHKMSTLSKKNKENESSFYIVFHPFSTKKIK